MTAPWVALIALVVLIVIVLTAAWRCGIIDALRIEAPGFADRVIDYFCDAWYTFRPDRNMFWDTVPYAYRTRKPKSGPELDDLPILRRCRTCRARVGQRCTTSAGKVTGFHEGRNPQAVTAGTGATA